MKVVRVTDVYGHIIFYCDTVREAEAFISGMQHAGDHDMKESIHAGNYSIDAPEELVNPAQHLKARGDFK